MSSSLQIGTRGSVLALAQTDWVLGELRRAAPGQDMGGVIIETEGDRDQTSSLASVSCSTRCSHSFTLVGRQYSRRR